MALAIGPAFVVGLICGQVITRNITAWVMAILSYVVFVAPSSGWSAPC